MSRITIIRAARWTAAALAAGMLAGCLGWIDEDAELDPRAMGAPGDDTPVGETYPPGHAANNPVF